MMINPPSADQMSNDIFRHNSGSCSSIEHSLHDGDVDCGLSDDVSLSLFPPARGQTQRPRPGLVRLLSPSTSSLAHWLTFSVSTHTLSSRLHFHHALLPPTSHEARMSFVDEELVSTSNGVSDAELYVLVRSMMMLIAVTEVDRFVNF
jgi:hypothetical protein